MKDLPSFFVAQEIPSNFLCNKSISCKRCTALRAEQKTSVKAICFTEMLSQRKKRMRKAGLEPARYCYHRHLKPARLPIPPLPHLLYEVV